VRGGLTEAERHFRHKQDDTERTENQRVLAALDGVHVRLSAKERDSVVAVAALAGIPADVWAPVLGISRKFGLQRMRDSRDRLADPQAYIEERRLAAQFTSSMAVAA
jgi:hypothetical protein